MEINKILHLSTLAGKTMLESGGETYRVEETICRICESFGVDEADAFVTPTGIMVSIVHNNQTYSLIKRVTSRGVDLNKIHEINDISRKLGSEIISIDDFDKELLRVMTGERYNTFDTLLFSAIGSGAFAMLFNGTFKDAITAFIAGLTIKALSIYFQKVNLNQFFINSICAGIAAILVIIMFNLGIASNIDKSIIGTIMLLVPGLAITNAIRDTIAGDLVSGLTKAAEAFLVAVSIAVGTGAVLSFYINTLGGAI
ncbi:MAG: threonine/serine exporter family protein [Clostridium sp.]